MLGIRVTQLAGSDAVTLAMGLHAFFKLQKLYSPPMKMRESTSLSLLPQRVQLSVSVAASSTAAAADKAALQRRSQAVQSFFQDRLGLTPADNTGAYLSYHIPASQASALPEFLQELEAAGPELGVADININLTSLEEVRHECNCYWRRAPTLY